MLEVTAPEVAPVQLSLCSIFPELLYKNNSMLGLDGC